MVVSAPRRGTGRMRCSTFVAETVFVVSAAIIAPHHPSNGQPRRPKEAPMMSASARRRIDPARGRAFPTLARAGSTAPHRRGSNLTRPRGDNPAVGSARYARLVRGKRNRFHAPPARRHPSHPSTQPGSVAFVLERCRDERPFVPLESSPQTATLPPGPGNALLAGGPWRGASWRTKDSLSGRDCEWRGHGNAGSLRVHQITNWVYVTRPSAADRRRP